MTGQAEHGVGISHKLVGRMLDKRRFTLRASRRGPVRNSRWNSPQRQDPPKTSTVSERRSTSLAWVGDGPGVILEVTNC